LHSDDWQKELFQEYVFGKQTLKQLADENGISKKTIQKYLDQYKETQPSPRNVCSGVIGIDCSFFGRGYGVIVVRCPGLKQDLYWKEITTENKVVYQEARRCLARTCTTSTSEATGFRIQVVVLDAKHGIREVFSDRVIQICQYHQQQIVGRYLTARPKTEAGLELKILASVSSGN